VLHGSARFKDNRNLSCNSTTAASAWWFDRCLIATGASPAVPPIPA
jgi:mercuric reductase